MQFHVGPRHIRSSNRESDCATVVMGWGAKNSFGFENLACGFTRNNNSASPVLSNDGTNKNGKGDYCQNLTKPNPVASRISRKICGIESMASVSRIRTLSSQPPA